MPLKIVDEGASKMMTILFGADNKQTTWKLRLMAKATSGTADPTLADSDTYASHASGWAVASGGGYADITINAQGGSAPAATVSTVGGIVQVAWPEQTFTFTGALTTNTTICGAQIVNATDSILIAEEVLTNFTPANNGDTYKVTPVIKLGNGTPA
jgi:hypothetical protein